MLSLPSSYTTPMQYYFGFCVYSQRSFKQSNTRYIFFCLIFLSALLRYNLHAVNDMFNLHTFITSDLKTHSWNHLQIKSENIHHLSKLHCSPLFLSLAQPYLCPQATTNLLLLWISLYFLEFSALHILAWKSPFSCMRQQYIRFFGQAVIPLYIHGPLFAFSFCWWTFQQFLVWGY